MHPDRIQEADLFVGCADRGPAHDGLYRVVKRVGLVPEDALRANRADPDVDFLSREELLGRLSPDPRRQVEELMENPPEDPDLLQSVVEEDIGTREQSPDVYTVVFEEGRWRRARRIRRITVDGVEFLKTSRNRRKGDELDLLPDCCSDGP